MACGPLVLGEIVGDLLQHLSQQTKKVGVERGEEDVERENERKKCDVPCGSLVLGEIVGDLL
jgi:hypothetical protein